MTMIDRLKSIANQDAVVVAAKNKQYGESWCRRGGQQAFAVIWRKADRIESILTQMNNGYDIFEAWRKNPGNVRDDIQDLRQYFLLLEEYLTRSDVLVVSRNPEQDSLPVEDFLTVRAQVPRL